MREEIVALVPALLIFALCLLWAYFVWRHERLRLLAVALLTFGAAFVSGTYLSKSQDQPPGVIFLLSYATPAMAAGLLTLFILRFAAPALRYLAYGEFGAIGLLCLGFFFASALREVPTHNDSLGWHYETIWNSLMGRLLVMQTIGIAGCGLLAWLSSDHPRRRWVFLFSVTITILTFISAGLLIRSTFRGDSTLAFWGIVAAGTKIAVIGMGLGWCQTSRNWTQVVLVGTGLFSAWLLLLWFVM
ncbi:MAG: hypothetical protein H7A21_18990 [Spirochaetales bacterium]|nr:hypothetical protein [Leptospiraceae bacterium]MCP5483531.1 hypothetical protein [Spirochaetales bacterium]MCP5486898.1 hypothetical protein [Spirochaetales bacterium]